MFTYSQQSGVLDHDGQQIATGYSGHGTGLNNPAAQGVVGVGPIPQGMWDIGTAFDHPHLGPCVFHLTPAPGTDPLGRSAFFIHGDNPDMNRSASDGCIILDRTAREYVRDSGDTQLTVTP